MPSDRKDFRILIVEGSSYYARLFTGWALEMGLGEVRHCADAKTAWAALLTEKFDLLFCDKNVGSEDGLELTRTLRITRENPNRYVPIIFMATASTQRLVEHARDCGISEFLAKPVSRKSFSERVLAIQSKPRNFVKAGPFFGPDRRRRPDNFKGNDRRTRNPEKIDANDDTFLV